MSLEKQIVEVFDPSSITPLSKTVAEWRLHRKKLLAGTTARDICGWSECERLIYGPDPWCPECRPLVLADEIERRLLELHGIDPDCVGEFCETDGEELSPIGEFYHGPITYDGPKYRCTDEQNELLRQLKALNGGRL